MEKGIYDVYLSELDIHVSNTLSEDELNRNGEPISIKRRTPLLLDGLQDIAVNGKGALIKSHGRMTQIILKKWCNMAKITGTDCQCNFFTAYIKR